MSEPSLKPLKTPGQSNGRVSLSAFDWPRFPLLEQAAETIPYLHFPGAQTVARDRWERLVTRIDISGRREDVWRALTEPDAIKHWLALCHGSLEVSGKDCILDFEDGEFFLCRTTLVRQPGCLQYLWRWLGIGQATTVTWDLEDLKDVTRITVVEEAINPPWDWQTWNGGGWPGILNQLAAYLRTGTDWRWPWRRMGPYAQVELAVPYYAAWDQLFSPGGLRYWLQVTQGELMPGGSLTILMGDASGQLEMGVRTIVRPGQSPPSFLPAVDFILKRPVWQAEVGGRMWLEPAGWGRSLFQTFLYNWENVAPGLQLSERKIVAGFLAGAAQRASLLCGDGTRGAPHGWSAP